MESSRCQCFDGGKPKNEVCNNIVDDCDGKVDEDISCCRSGDERPCGSNVGTCKQGKEKCVDNVWSGVCIGEVGPTEEICWDNLDNDCDGIPDDGCLLEETCNNGIQDPNEEGVDCGPDCKRPCQAGTVSFIMAILVILVILLGIYWIIHGKKEFYR